MGGEFPAISRLPPVTSDGPVEQQGARGSWKQDGEGKSDRAAHASAEHEGRIYFEKIQQTFCLAGVKFPAEFFHSPARPSGFPPVVSDYLKLRGKPVQGIDLFPGG